MKFKKMSLLFGVLGLMFVLTACGEQDVKSGTVQVLEYDELIKKLDNEESFFLITTDAKIEDIEKTNVVGAFEEKLESYDKGAYLVSLSGKDYSVLESDYNRDTGKVDYSDYAHPKQEVYGGFWSPSMDGLVYVEAGKVIFVTRGGDSLHDVPVKRAIDDGGVRLEEGMKLNVDEAMGQLAELGFEIE